MSRTDIDDDVMPQIILGTAERKLLANLPLKSDMLDCALRFLYKASPDGSLQFLDSLPVQFRLVSHRPSINLQQVCLQHYPQPSNTHARAACAILASAFCCVRTVVFAVEYHLLLTPVLILSLRTLLEHQQGTCLPSRLKRVSSAAALWQLSWMRLRLCMLLP